METCMFLCLHVKNLHESTTSSLAWMGRYLKTTVIMQKHFSNDSLCNAPRHGHIQPSIVLFAQ